MEFNKDSPRRNFIKKSAALATVSLIGLKNVLASDYDLQENSKGILNESSKKLMDMLGIKYPIIQAPTAGPATEPLAIAVSNSGALGALPLTWDSPQLSFNRVTNVASKSKGSFFANYVLNFPPNSLDKAIEAGIKIVQFSWGVPDKEIISKLKRHSIIIGIQVVSKENAQYALEMDPDYLVCQGNEAGGHVHASKSLDKALAEVLSVAGEIPVAASGGISTGHDIRKYINQGAAAVVLGSRFVATKESIAHEKYKNALVDSTGDDTVFTVCLNKGWENATHRIIRNSTFKMWEAAGCPQPGLRPGEKDIVVEYPDGSKLERYSGNVPTEIAKGDVTAIGMYAGKGIDAIKDIPSANELIKRLWKEFEN
jgi:nitronate monooxygenase